jgi:hypothetical protein
MQRSQLKQFRGQVLLKVLRIVFVGAVILFATSRIEAFPFSQLDLLSRSYDPSIFVTQGPEEPQSMLMLSAGLLLVDHLLRRQRAQLPAVNLSQKSTRL